MTAQQMNGIRTYTGRFTEGALPHRLASMWATTVPGVQRGERQVHGEVMEKWV